MLVKHSTLKVDPSPSSECEDFEYCDVTSMTS